MHDFACSFLSKKFFNIIFIVIIIAFSISKKLYFIKKILKVIYMFFYCFIVLFSLLSVKNNFASLYADPEIDFEKQEASIDFINDDDDDVFGAIEKDRKNRQQKEADFAKKTKELFEAQQKFQQNSADDIFEKEKIISDFESEKKFLAKQAEFVKDVSPDEKITFILSNDNEKKRLMNEGFPKKEFIDNKREKNNDSIISTQASFLTQIFDEPVRPSVSDVNQTIDYSKTENQDYNKKIQEAYTYVSLDKFLLNCNVFEKSFNRLNHLSIAHDITLKNFETVENNTLFLQNIINLYEIIEKIIQNNVFLDQNIAEKNTYQKYAKNIFSKNIQAMLNQKNGVLSTVKAVDFFLDLCILPKKEHNLLYFCIDCAFSIENICNNMKNLDKAYFLNKGSLFDPNDYQSSDTIHKYCGAIIKYLSFLSRTKIVKNKNTDEDGAGKAIFRSVKDLEYERLLSKYSNSDKREIIQNKDYFIEELDFYIPILRQEIIKLQDGGRQGSYNDDHITEWRDIMQISLIIVNILVSMFKKIDEASQLSKKFIIPTVKKSE